MVFEDLYIGSKVVVKNYSGLSSGMRKYIGKVVTITKLRDKEDIRVMEDSGIHIWYIADFERIVDETCCDPDCMLSFAEMFMSGGVVCG